jgi:protein TonB
LLAAFLLANTMGAFASGPTETASSAPIEVALADPTPEQPVPPQPVQPPVPPKAVELPKAPGPADFAAASVTPPPQPAIAPPPAPPPPQTASAAGEQGARPALSPSRERNEYLSTLIAWLNRHKLYPTEARRARVQGVATVRFTIDPQGRVLDAVIVKSSGQPLLDDAALDVFTRANPVPAIPRAMAQGPLTLTVPIEFSLTTR